MSGGDRANATTTTAPPTRASASARGVAAALFDWDGTLVDSRAALLTAWRESTSSTLGRGYPSTPAEEDLVFTRPGSQIWPTLVSTEDELEALVASFQTAYEKSSGDVCAFPGVRAMLEDLRRDGVSIAVVTSKARRRYAPDALHADLADLVDVSICAEDADGAKPDPRPLLRALERLEVAASQAIMVGDTPVDIAAGIAAGTRTIGVEWGHAGESELLAAGADAVARDPRQVCAFVLAGAAPSDTAGARSDASGSVT